MLGGIIMKKKVLSIIFASLITASSLMMFAGCGKKNIATPDEATIVATSDEVTTSPTTTVPAVTVPKAVKDLVDKGEIKVDKDGNITDKNGKKVEVKDGKVEVKTDDGKTVTVKADDVKTTVSNNNNSNKGNTEKKEDTKSNTSSSKTNTSDNNKKPASNSSNSSNNNQTPAKPSNSSNNNNKPASNTETTVAQKYRYYKHHDAVTVYHEAVTKHHDAEWVVTGTHEEDVYEWVGCNVCNDCGKKLPDSNTLLDHLEWEADHGGKGSYHYEKEYVKTGTKTVEDGEWKAAYDEVITPAWTETIPAYDEEVTVNDDWDKKVLIN